MHILQTATFSKIVKKLHSNQKNDLDNAIKDIVNNIHIGDLKKGDLSGIRVYKFKMVGQLTLLAYEFHDHNNSLILLAFGSHENFYRNLKK